MFNNEISRELNKEVQELETELIKAKNKVIENLMSNISKEMFENNKREPLTVDEIKEYLNDFYLKIKRL